MKAEAESRVKAVAVDPSKAKIIEVQDGKKKNNKGVDKKNIYSKASEKIDMDLTDQNAVLRSTVATKEALL